MLIICLLSFSAGLFLWIIIDACLTIRAMNYYVHLCDLVDFRKNPLIYFKIPHRDHLKYRSHKLSNFFTHEEIYLIKGKTKEDYLLDKKLGELQ